MDDKLKDVLDGLIKRLADGEDLNDIAYDQLVKKGYTKETIKELMDDLDKTAEDEMPGASKSILFWLGMAAGMDLSKASMGKVVAKARDMEVMHQMVVSRSLVNQKIKQLKN